MAWGHNLRVRHGCRTLSASHRQGYHLRTPRSSTKLRWYAQQQHVFLANMWKLVARHWLQKEADLTANALTHPRTFRNLTWNLTLRWSPFEFAIKVSKLQGAVALSKRRSLQKVYAAWWDTGVSIHPIPQSKTLQKVRSPNSDCLVAGNGFALKFQMSTLPALESPNYTKLTFPQSLSQKIDQLPWYHPENSGILELQGSETKISKSQRQYGSKCAKHGFTIWTWMTLLLQKRGAITLKHMTCTLDTQILMVSPGKCGDVLCQHKSNNVKHA